MEQKLYDFFDRQTMPEDCAQRIQASLESEPVKKTSRPKWQRIAAIAAVLALTVVIAFQFDAVRAQAAEVYQIVTHKLNRKADIPAEVRNGRLYFIANGENIDITDECSAEKAFIYTIQDNSGFYHHIIIGGTPENWGYQIFIQNPKGDYGGWVGGEGTNHLDPDNDWDPYGWVLDAAEKLDIPWPC